MAAPPPPPPVAPPMPPPGGGPSAANPFREWIDLEYKRQKRKQKESALAAKKKATTFDDFERELNDAKTEEKKSEIRKNFLLTVASLADVKKALDRNMSAELNTELAELWDELSKDEKNRASAAWLPEEALDKEIVWDQDTLANVIAFHVLHGTQACKLLNDIVRLLEKSVRLETGNYCSQEQRRSNSEVCQQLPSLTEHLEDAAAKATQALTDLRFTLNTTRTNLSASGEKLNDEQRLNDEQMERLSFDLNNDDVTAQALALNLMRAKAEDYLAAIDKVCGAVRSEELFGEEWSTTEKTANILKEFDRRHRPEFGAGKDSLDFEVFKRMPRGTAGDRLPEVYDKVTKMIPKLITEARSKLEDVQTSFENLENAIKQTGISVIIPELPSSSSGERAGAGESETSLSCDAESLWKNSLVSRAQELVKRMMSLKNVAEVDEELDQHLAKLSPGELQVLFYLVRNQKNSALWEKLDKLGMPKQFAPAFLFQLQSSYKKHPVPPLEPGWNSDRTIDEIRRCTGIDMTPTDPLNAPQRIGFNRRNFEAAREKIKKKLAPTTADKTVTEDTTATEESEVVSTEESEEDDPKKMTNWRQRMRLQLDELEKHRNQVEQQAKDSQRKAGAPRPTLLCDRKTLPDVLEPDKFRAEVLQRLDVVVPLMKKLAPSLADDNYAQEDLKALFKRIKEAQDSPTTDGSRKELQQQNVNLFNALVGACQFLQRHGEEATALQGKVKDLVELTAKLSGSSAQSLCDPRTLPVPKSPAFGPKVIERLNVVRLMLAAVREVDDNVKRTIDTLDQDISQAVRTRENATPADFEGADVHLIKTLQRACLVLKNHHDDVDVNAIATFVERMPKKQRVKWGSYLRNAGLVLALGTLGALGAGLGGERTSGSGVSDFGTQDPITKSIQNVGNLRTNYALSTGAAAPSEFLGQRPLAQPMYEKHPGNRENWAGPQGLRKDPEAAQSFREREALLLQQVVDQLNTRVNELEIQKLDPINADRLEDIEDDLEETKAMRDDWQKEMERSSDWTSYLSKFLQRRR